MTTPNSPTTGMDSAFTSPMTPAAPSGPALSVAAGVAYPSSQAALLHRATQLATALVEEQELNKRWAGICTDTMLALVGEDGFHQCKSTPSILPRLALTASLQIELLQARIEELEQELARARTAGAG